MERERTESNVVEDRRELSICCNLRIILVNLKQKAGIYKVSPQRNFIGNCIFVYLNIIGYKPQIEKDDNSE